MVGKTTGSRHNVVGKATGSRHNVVGKATRRGAVIMWWVKLR